MGFSVKKGMEGFKVNSLSKDMDK